MLAPRNEATVWPAFAVSSSVIVVSDGADAVRTGASLVPVMVTTKVLGRYPAIAIVDRNRVGQRQDLALRQIIERRRGRRERQIDRAGRRTGILGHRAWRHQRDQRGSVERKARGGRRSPPPPVTVALWPTSVRSTSVNVTGMVAVSGAVSVCSVRFCCAMSAITGASSVPLTVIDEGLRRYAAIAIVDRNRVGERQDLALRQIIERGRGRRE